MKKHKLILIIPVITGIFCWTLMTDATEHNPGTLEYLELFAQCYELIQSRYIEETSPLILAEGAVEGMLLESSPYSALLPVRGYSGFIPPFGPLNTGIIAGYKEPLVRVIDVLPGSPAAESGIHSGDSIIRVNGEVTPFLTIDRVERMLSGEMGDIITVLIQRDVTGKLEELEIELSPYETLPAGIDVTQEDGYQIVRIEGTASVSFPEVLYTELSDNNELRLPVILDLRNFNRGDEVIGIRMADVFVADGQTLLHTCSGNSEKSGIVVANDGWALDNFPLAVIIDRTSAGPAETFAAALQKSGRAVITGDSSFGRAVYREILQIDDHYEILLVTALFCSEPGIEIHIHGVKPDVPVVLPVPDNMDPYISTAKMQIQQPAPSI